MYYFSGSNYRIHLRLTKEQRNTDCVCIQFVTREELSGTPGWRPLPEENFWPICPTIGDSFWMKSYLETEESEEEEAMEYKRWEVIGRDIMASGPSAKEMNGIVRLIVQTAVLME